MSVKVKINTPYGESFVAFFPCRPVVGDVVKLEYYVSDDVKKHYKGVGVMVSKCMWVRETTEEDMGQQLLVVFTQKTGDGKTKKENTKRGDKGLGSRHH